MEKPNEPDAPYDFAPQAPAPKPAPKPVEVKREAVPARTEKAEAAPVVKGDATQTQVCPVCGLTMPGRTKRSRCAECGAPLDAATADFLQFADPAWVRKLAWGPMLMGAAVVPHLAGAGLSWGGVPAWVLPTVHLAGSGLLAWGTWVATQADPRQGKVSGAGWTARVCTGLVAMMWLGMALLTFLNKMPGNNWLVIATLVPLAVGVMFIGFSLAALAGRVPNDALAGQFQTLAWLMPLVVLVVAVYQFFDLHNYMKWIFFCSFPLAGGLAGIVLWGAWSMVRLSLDLRQAARAGDEILAKRAARQEKDAAGPAKKA